MGVIGRRYGRGIAGACAALLTAAASGSTGAGAAASVDGGIGWRAGLGLHGVAWAAAVVQQGQPPVEEPPPPEEEPLRDPAVERIIGDLERAATPRRPVEPVTQPATTPARPGAPLAGVRPMARGTGAEGRQALVPEGTFLPSRRGRMSRSAAGEWLFTFDGGTDGMVEPAMVLLPCRTLEAMENRAEQMGDAAVFEVSGQVFVYRGRNYLMPTLWRAPRRTDEVIPLQ